MPDNSSTVRDFLMKEIEYLRNGIEESIKETRSLERYSLLVTGVIWSWCASANDGIGLKIIIWFPSFLTALFGIRAWGIAREIRTIDLYLKRVEETFTLPDGLGWERDQAQNRSLFEVRTVYIYWAVLQIATVLIAVLYDWGALSNLVRAK